MRPVLPIEIVAFLQNPWFPMDTADRHILLYRDDQDFHRRLLVQTMTGRRLYEAFGDWFAQIHWDNANWRPVWMPGGKQSFDPFWMSSVIGTQKPKLIITFGREAQMGLDAITWPHGDEIPDFLYCHHPNARFKTQADLAMFALKVKGHVVKE